MQVTTTELDDVVMLSLHNHYKEKTMKFVIIIFTLMLSLVDDVTSFTSDFFVSGRTRRHQTVPHRLHYRKVVGRRRRRRWNVLFLVDNIDDPGNDDDSTLLSPSLDDVLDMARKRSANLSFYRIRAAFDKAVFSVPGPYPTVFTVKDISYIVIAILIKAKGFAIGLLLGKITAPLVREIFNPSPSVMIILMPLWPVLWAIIFDQVLLHQ
jgi:hypothetical protein